MPVSPWAPSTPVVGRNPVAEEPNAKKTVSLVEAMDEEVKKKKKWNEDSSSGGEGTQQQQQQQRKGSGEGWRRREKRLQAELAQARIDAKAL